MQRAARSPNPRPLEQSKHRPRPHALCLLVAGLAAAAPLALPAAAIIIISPHNEAIRREFGRGFSRWHEAKHGAPATVEWRDIGGTSDNLRFVLSEFQARPDGIGVDLFFGGGGEPYLLFAERGLSVPYRLSDELLRGIPQSFGGIVVYDAAYRWYGAALSSFGILQNQRVRRLANLPAVERWEDLANPRLAGWVGAGDPRNSGTMNNMYEAILQAYGWGNGWALLTEIAGNVRLFDRLSATTAKDTALGDTACAFAIDFYGFSQVAAVGREQLSFLLPADFTAISPDGIAILKGAPHLELAQRFLEFVMSEPGQMLWFLPRGHPDGPVDASIERMSVRSDFYARFRGISNIQFSPFDREQRFIYDASLAQRRRDVVAGLFGALLVDLHPELKAAWSSLVARGLPATERRSLGSVPVDEAQALELAAEAWKNAARRNRLKLEWQQWAREKYRRIQNASAARLP